jgi:redox-sensitive bicupin YhaK (pirin superfamily)
MVQSKKQILLIHPGNGFHWVGDGFKVNNYFPGHAISAKEASPFFMLDYNAPLKLAPSDESRGVGTHPHKGFETVSIIWDGAVSHADSAGNSGTIGKGDVQWMTAGAGILHKEYLEENFSRSGGSMHMVQLWVNLPAQFKQTSPRYQDLRSADIPRVVLPQEAGHLRLIAGKYDDLTGAAHTFSPVQLYDVYLHSGKSVSFNFSDGDTLMILLASGEISDEAGKKIKAQHLAYFNRAGSEVVLTANEASHFLVLSGTPIQEPIAHYGPFVMNTQEEIMTAIEEFRQGKFGMLD